MWSKDHGISGLHCKHDVAHRRHDRIRHRSHRRNHPHRFCHEHHVRVRVLADDASGFLVLQVVPNDAGLALVLENLVLIHTNAGLIDRHPRQFFGIVVNIFADALHDRIHLLLGKRFEDRLRGPSPGYELLDLAIFG